MTTPRPTSEMNITPMILFVSAAPTLRYGDVVVVIDAAKGAGVMRVGIITEGRRRSAGG